MTNRKKAVAVLILLSACLVTIAVAVVKWQSAERDHRAQVAVSGLGGTYTLQSAAVLRDTGIWRSYFERAIADPITEVDLSMTAWPRETTPFPQVTDNDLKVIAPLSRLQRLSLRGMPVTDAAVDELAQFSELKSLDIRETQISEQGSLRLKAALPACNVLTDEAGEKPSMGTPQNR